MWRIWPLILPVNHQRFVVLHFQIWFIVSPFHRPVWFTVLQLPSLIDHRCKFSHLKFLKLVLFFSEDVGTLSLISFLRSAPFIEKLEMHVSALVSSNVYVTIIPWHCHIMYLYYTTNSYYWSSYFKPQPLRIHLLSLLHILISNSQLKIGCILETFL